MTKKKEKVAIFIDSANFYGLVSRKIGVPDIELKPKDFTKIQNSDFDLEKIAKFLAEGKKIIKGGKKIFIGTIRKDFSKKAYLNEANFLSRLQGSDWKIYSRTLRKRTESIKIDKRVEEYRKIKKKGIKEIVYHRLREKGIDVMLAINLITESILGRIDRAILVSSDTDLVPAVNFIHSFSNVKVEYVGFSIPEKKIFSEEYPDGKTIFHATRPTNALIQVSDIQRVLKEEELKKFLTKK